MIRTIMEIHFYLEEIPQSLAISMGKLWPLGLTFLMISSWVIYHNVVNGI